jgi:hypothetical protein
LSAITQINQRPHEYSRSSFVRCVVRNQTLRDRRPLRGIDFRAIYGLQFVLQQRPKLARKARPFREQPLIEGRAGAIKFFEKFAGAEFSQVAAQPVDWRRRRAQHR